MPLSAHDLIEAQHLAVVLLEQHPLDRLPVQPLRAYAVMAGNFAVTEDSCKTCAQLRGKHMELSSVEPVEDKKSITPFCSKCQTPLIIGNLEKWTVINIAAFEQDTQVNTDPYTQYLAAKGFALIVNTPDVAHMLLEPALAWIRAIIPPS